MPRSWNEAAVWIIFNLAGHFLPIGAGAFMLLATHSAVTLAGFTDAGQFAAYSISLLTTTYFLVVKPSSSPIPNVRALGFLFLVSYACAFVLTFAGAMASSGSAIDTAYVEVPSICVFLFSAALTFVFVALDQQRSQPDIAAMNEHRFEALESEFSKKLTETQ